MLFSSFVGMHCEMGEHGKLRVDCKDLTDWHSRLTVLSHKVQENKMRDFMAGLWKEEEGQDLVEYGLLVVLIALFAVAAMSNLASGISDAFSNASAQLTSAT